ncbi:hypothetical protein EJ110_NYTH00362 [Nymphaea thermarum]|nr:hypothetical protein EJ110_NYTH00362 [Nymphaea thermarum]
MALPPAFYFLSFFLLFSSSAVLGHPHPHPAGSPQPSSGGTLRSTCAPTRFPADCQRVLSGHLSPSGSPFELAQATISASLAKADSASQFVTNALKSHPPVGREGAALHDCADELSQSLDELSRSLAEIRSSTAAGSAPSRWQLSNVETWVSAALTNDDTCLDGFRAIEGAIKTAVRSRVTDVARATSNALYFINRLASR